MAESTAITFKVTPEVAARLATIGREVGKSQHLVAKEIVLKGLIEAGQRTPDHAIVEALFEVREELSQLSDLVVSGRQAASQPMAARSSPELATLASAIKQLREEVLANHSRPDPPTIDADAIAQSLSRQAQALERYEARIETLAAMLEQSNVVPHVTNFAKKTRRHQIQQSEQTASTLDKVRVAMEEVHQEQSGLRHDLARTVKLLLGYVENLTQQEADLLVTKLLTPLPSEPCSPSKFADRLTTFSTKSSRTTTS